MVTAKRGIDHTDRGRNLRRNDEIMSLSSKLQISSLQLCR